LSANYIKDVLEEYYPVVYTGNNGRVAHEYLMDLRHFKRKLGIDVNDVAKRLIDYGFHAPTMSWPVMNTMMVEPTESEPKDELDRFCEAMKRIYEEIQEVARGDADEKDNVLKHAPHTIEEVVDDDWSHPYSREKAAFPLPFVREDKFWSPVARVNNPYGDRNLVCNCPPIESYQEGAAVK
jgi:glycine dehydrogenase